MHTQRKVACRVLVFRTRARTQAPTRTFTYTQTHNACVAGAELKDTVLTLKLPPCRPSRTSGLTATGGGTAGGPTSQHTLPTLT